ncbi:hypothetical protein Tco_0356900 [Tanacetum coccineum]
MRLSRGGWPKNGGVRGDGSGVNMVMVAAAVGGGHGGEAAVVMMEMKRGGVVVEGSGSGDGGGWRQNYECGDRTNRVMGSVFGLGRKSPPENFSGGGGVVAGGWPEMGRERGEGVRKMMYSVCVFVFIK